MSNLAKTGNAESRKYYLKLFIGLAIILVISILPCPDPITRTGMVMLALFFGLVYFYTFVDTMWPNLIAWLILAFFIFSVYPDSAGAGVAGIEEVLNQVFGGSLMMMLLGVFLILHALEKSGTMYRIAMAFLTSRFAKKGAWPFTMMFLLATFFMGLFMDSTALTAVMARIGHNIFEKIGYKKGDKYPETLIILIAALTSIAFAVTPIGHVVTILFISMVASATGVTLSLVKYIALGLPIGLIILVVCYLYFRFIVKPDVSPFENANFDELDAMRPPKMDAHEKGVVAISLVTVVLMILPSLLDSIIPGNAFSTFMIGLSSSNVYLYFFALMLMCVIRIKGKPMMDFRAALQSTDWTALLLICTIVVVGTCLGTEHLGIIGFSKGIIESLFGNMGPGLTVALLFAISIIVTNILNNVAVGCILIPLIVPLCEVTGASIAIASMAVCIGSQLGFTTPAANATLSVIVTDEYCTPSKILKQGLLLTVLCVVVCAILIMPLGMLVFGG